MEDQGKARAPKIGMTGLEPGWHEGLSMEDYLGDPAVSASTLWYLHEETPAHLQAKLLADEDDDTPAKALGSITHTAVFEPEAFDERYVVINRCEGTKRDGEQCSYQGSVWRDGQSFCGNHDPAKGQPVDARVTLVTASDKANALAMRRALHAHPTARSLLAAPGPREVTAVWRDPETGLWCRIRPDHTVEDPEEALPVYHWSSVNLKTTGKTAAPHGFTRDTYRRGLYFKAAFYRMGLRELWPVEPQNFFYPTVESFGGREVIVYRLHEDALDIGEAEVRGALNLLSRCIQSGDWPGYGPAVHNLTLPDWRLKQVHDIDFLELDEVA